MLALTTIKRLAAMTLVGGVLAVAPAMAPAANAAENCSYSAGETADVSVSVSPPPGKSGDSFQATANVTLSRPGVPVPNGTVTFSYNGSSNTKAIGAAGTATSDAFTAQAGGGAVSASYSSTCLSGQGQITGKGTATVLGEEASAGGNNGGNAGVSGSSGSNGSAGVSGSSGSSGTSGGLADTGVDSQTQLLAVLGLGLVTAGGISLLMHRRRVQA